MSRIFFWGVLAVVMGVCGLAWPETEQGLAGFNLDGTSTLVLSNKTPDTITVTFENWYQVPLGVEAIDERVPPGTVRELTLTAQGVNELQVQLGEDASRIISYPGALIGMEITGTAVEPVFSFTGNAAVINKFLARRTARWGRPDAQGYSRAMTTQSAGSVQELFAVYDSIYAEDLALLESEADQLPEWYVDFEKQRLKYDNEGFKLNSVFYRRALMGRKEDLPPGYLDELRSELPVNVPELLGNNRYLFFLKDFIYASMPRDLSDMMPENDAQKMARYRSHDSVALPLLTGQVKEVYMAHTLAQRAEDNGYMFDEAWYEYVVSQDLMAAVKQEMNRDRLPPGSAMPYFYLEDLSGAAIEPGNWADSVVLINFWATWCKPCLKEFPHENDLVKAYADQPVKIVNICIESEEEAWRKYSERFELKTVNLFASGNWSDNLKDKFFIRSLPHSVLIGPNGKIIKNNAPRASGGADKLIKEALNSN